MGKRSALWRKLLGGLLSPLGEQPVLIKAQVQGQCLLRRLSLFSKRKLGAYKINPILSEGFWDVTRNLKVCRSTRPRRNMARFSFRSDVCQALRGRGRMQYWGQEVKTQSPKMITNFSTNPKLISGSQTHWRTSSLILQPFYPYSHFSFSPSKRQTSRFIIKATLNVFQFLKGSQSKTEIEWTVKK